MSLKRIDNWIGNIGGNSWSGFKNWWSGYSSFFGRFHQTGGKKLLTEILSESVTLGAAGFLALLAFAIPAFDETDTSWRSSGKYSVVFLDRYGAEIGQRGILHSDAVPLDEVPDHMIKATLATEDRRFFEHFGIDFLGTFRALVENVRANSVVQGGSTITQQLAKNLFLTSERSLRRKIKEAFLSLWLEARLTKKEILKLYFDRAYMGGGAFGVEAAAQFYFGKSVRDVTLAEAAMLAGLFKAPTKYAPHNDLRAAYARTEVVLTNLVQAGYMSEGQVHAARINPAEPIRRGDVNSPDYFLDWAFDEVKRLTTGMDEYVLRVKTTLDMDMQRNADKAVLNTLRQDGRARGVKQAALVAMETNGAVRAIVGGPDYGTSQFNRATQSKRQPGSSFKPYVYLTALENGFTPETRVVDGPVSCGRWSPRNYSGGYRGAMPMKFALMRSINTVAVKLSLKVGRKKVLATAKKLGAKHLRKSCSLALGDQGITLLQHTSAFAVFANGGMAVQPFSIEEIRNSSDHLLFSREQDAPKPKRLFSRETISQLNSMLGLVVLSGTARRAQLPFTTAAGKTGTTNGYKDAWFMGFTGKYVAGVWFGNDNYKSTNRVTGGSLPAKTWKEFMINAHLTPDIPKIPGLPLHPKQIEEMQKIAAAKKADPTLGSQTKAERGLSGKTRTVLKRITSTMRNAKELKPSASRDRRASQSGVDDPAIR